LLQHGSALLKHTLLLFHALEKGKEGMDLHLEFHPLTPQEFTPALLNRSRPLSILVFTVRVPLMVLMLTLCLVLITHERISFLFLPTPIARVQHERWPNHHSSE
jgi:hypothetical protein